MLSEKIVLEFLRDYCQANGIEYEKAVSQFHALSAKTAILCVSDPDAPEPDGLANEYETRMLPTLYIRLQPDGSLRAETTQYTKLYLS